MPAFVDELGALWRDALTACGDTPGGTTTCNVLGTSCGRWGRYHRFLEIVLCRYESTRAEYVAAMGHFQELVRGTPGSHSMTPEELAEDARTSELGTRLHLEIESFYTFSKIFLDRVADSLSWYFQYPLGGNGSSHNRLAFRAKTERLSRFEHFCREKKLTPTPSNLATLVERTADLVIPYRNDVIEHGAEPRLGLGTSFDGNGRVRIIGGTRFLSGLEGSPTGAAPRSIPGSSRPSWLCGRTGSAPTARARVTSIRLPSRK